MSWLGSESFADVFGLRPELYADYRAFAARVCADGLVDPPLLELCRVRVAQILGWATVPTALDDARVAALADWRHSRLFAPLERACLRLAEGFVLDPHGVSDADAAAVAGHLSPAEMVALIEALAVFDGFTRMRLILGATAE
ncbi:MAG: hypothetical protein U0802_16040 [Candidatus Binatia bacterium]